MARFLVLVAAFAVSPAAVAAQPSPDPYAASLAYAQCLRAHGVPHPLPDAKGDFSLTPAQDARLRAVPMKERRAAEDACFKYLKGLNLKPLSAKALAAARAVVADDGRCIALHGYLVGRPVAKNLARGRAFFGFDRAFRARPGTSRSAAKLAAVTHACEQQVDMAKRLDKIIAADRDTGRAQL